MPRIKKAVLDDISAEQLELLEKKKAIIKEKLKDLPHLSAYPFYKWSREYFESTARYNILEAGNQIGKSTLNINKCIDWATNKSKWPRLWKKRPMQFWYLYPSAPVLAAEWKKKWEPLCLPRGPMKTDDTYGWKDFYQDGKLVGIDFNTGVTVYFKTYSQKLTDLQAGTVDAIFADEEFDSEIFNELNSRLNTTEGYFHLVYTPTLGDPFWQELLEGGPRTEAFPDLKTWIVSLYDCLTYEDGSPGGYRPEQIERIKNTCTSEAEIQRRVYGKPQKDSSLIYAAFSPKKNVKPAHPLPAEWFIYAGIDIGSGGAQGHPAAIVFVAVSPDFQKARVFKGWRGDHEETTSGDVLLKYQELKGDLNVTAAYYDWHCKDIFTIATRLNEPLQPADKSHETGEQTLNVLFKNEMLAIQDKPELRPLIQELGTLLRKTAKQKAKDDFTDALRYACSKVPWDWNAIRSEPIKAEAAPSASVISRRRSRDFYDQDVNEQAQYFFEDEIEAWNELYEI